MKDLLERYGNLLGEVDSWFARCLDAYPESISCHHGCSCCCRGLFDITLLDALYLQSGLEALPAELKDAVLSRSQERLDTLAAAFPELKSPWVLNTVPETAWDEIMPEDDETPCVMLSDDGGCLAYDHRPMTCRLNGIPMIDTSGEELFDEWCSLNFVGLDPLLLEGLRFSFNELFAQELLLFREMTRRILGEPVNEIDTLIPAAAVLDLEAVVDLLKTDSK